MVEPKSNVSEIVDPGESAAPGARVRVRRKNDAPEPAPDANAVAESAEDTPPVTEAQVAPDTPEAPEAPVAAAPAPAAESQEAQEGAPDGEGQGGPRRRVFDPSGPKVEGKKKRKRRPKKVVSPRPHVADDEDFATLLAEQGQTMATGGEMEPGTEVSGIILQIGDENTFIDLGGKTEAFIATAELLDRDGKPAWAVGDPFKARVIRHEASGAVRLARKLKGGANVALIEAFEAGVPVDGQVSSVNKGGFEVEVMGSRGFCPISMIELGYTAEPEKHLGQTYTFKIIEYAEDGRRLVLSRSALLEEDNKARAEEIKAQLHDGAILKGHVRTIQDYGAFIDLGGGIDGLVHVSEISHERVGNPSEVLEVGQEVTVKVLRIEPGKKGDRIGLSIKATTDDPWSSIAGSIEPGAKLTGTVVRLAPFGAFVELQPGIDGLIHVSEMSWERHVKHPKDAVSVGDQVEVAVQDVNLEQRRISLSLKAALGDPWAGIEERYPAGKKVTATVERVTNFGVFAKVEPGIVALIPMSELQVDQGKRAERVYTTGMEVEATVLNADSDRRRLSLSNREGGGERRRPEQGQGRGKGRPRENRGGGQRQYKEAAGNFATLGDLLKAQLEKK